MHEAMARYQLHYGLKPIGTHRPFAHSLLKDHLRVEDRSLSGDIFPDSEAARPITGLLA